VHRDCPGDLSTFDYDGAGRLIREDNKHLFYNGYDQLKRVESPAGTTIVSHGYGYEGLRHFTSGSGNEQRWFTTSYSLVSKAGTSPERWHYIQVGDRLVARLSFEDSVSSIAGGLTVAGGAVPMTRAGTDPAAFRPPLGMANSALLVASLALCLATLLRRRRALMALTMALMALGHIGCDDTRRTQTSLEVVAKRLYFHHGEAAGPSMLTTSTGAVSDERRFEPFGQVIDGDLSKDPTNSLNKLTNPETGWSYHGARWMAPQTARWLTPDPPIKTPDVSIMRWPWTLHPYQYVGQNPNRFWDPDGKQPSNWNPTGQAGEFAKDVAEQIVIPFLQYANGWLDEAIWWAPIARWGMDKANGTPMVDTDAPAYQKGAEHARKVMIVKDAAGLAKSIAKGGWKWIKSRAHANPSGGPKMKPGAKPPTPDPKTTPPPPAAESPHGAPTSTGSGATKLRPEEKYLGSKKHGLDWKEGPAEARKTGKPQGQWGSQADLDFAAEKAAGLKPGEGAYFDLPPGSLSVVHKPDGTTVPATRIWVRNNGTGTFHGAPWE
jgi:RHS repeat-associated protein